jgi:pilus assembly protein Flp/PilA
MPKYFLQDRRGTTAIEYGLIAALVGVGIIAGLSLFKDELAELFTVIQEAMAGAS